jgi:hypothetical protein
MRRKTRSSPPQNAWILYRKDRRSKTLPKTITKNRPSKKNDDGVVSEEKSKLSSSSKKARREQKEVLYKPLVIVLLIYPNKNAERGL